jgi:membrane protease YdiL (CAAX protease family)
LFLLAVVGAAFVPLSWPDALRRPAHPTIFVPLGLALTVRMLRKDASELPADTLFNPWPVGRTSVQWLLLGIALSCIVALTFVLAFGLRWVSNPHWSGTTTGFILWAILLTAAAEEIAFRGYAFWRLIRLLGFWPAQAIVATLFVISHLTLGGSGFFPALVGNVTGSVLYGIAFARSGGIAAPIALHSGWNIAQHMLLSPLDQSATPLVPTFPHPPTTWDYAAMLAIIGIVMVAASIDILTPANRRERPRG